MKKSLFTFAALLALAFSAAAQDTLFLLGPKSSYLPYSWDFIPGDTVTKVTQCCIGNMAYYRYTEDPLTIYGIAASLMPKSVSASMPGYYADTSLEMVKGMLRLFNHALDSTVSQIGEDLPVCLAESPTFYVKLNLTIEQGYLDYLQYPVYPVYERYFNNPVTVTDSFYVGLYQTCNTFDSILDAYRARGMCFNGFKKGTGWVNIPALIYFGYWDGEEEGWTYRTLDLANPYIFPILTPIPDTIVMASDTLMHSGDTIVVRDTLIIGGDTIFVNGKPIVCYDTIVHYDTIIYNMGIEDGSLLQRLTGVMPNPAAETAKVVSSFGMTLVEVYNMAGEKVHTLRLPDAPLTATLDVGRWPSGAYILRIHTPQGIAVKKLAVRH